jgi:hypothetical protein
LSGGVWPRHVCRGVGFSRRTSTSCSSCARGRSRTAGGQQRGGVEQQERGTVGHTSIISEAYTVARSLQKNVCPHGRRTSTQVCIVKPAGITTTLQSSIDINAQHSTHWQCHMSLESRGRPPSSPRHHCRPSTCSGRGCTSRCQTSCARPMSSSGGGGRPSHPTGRAKRRSLQGGQQGCVWGGGGVGGGRGRAHGSLSAHMYMPHRWGMQAAHGWTLGENNMHAVHGVKQQTDAL